MNSNAIRLVRDLYAHFDPDLEISEPFVEQSLKHAGTVRSVLSNVILQYDPGADVSDELLTNKLESYGLDGTEVWVDQEAKVVTNEVKAVSEESVVLGNTQSSAQEEAQNSEQNSDETRSERRGVTKVLGRAALFFFGLVLGGVVYGTLLNGGKELMPQKMSEQPTFAEHVSVPINVEGHMDGVSDFELRLVQGLIMGETHARGFVQGKDLVARVDCVQRNGKYFWTASAADKSSQGLFSSVRLRSGLRDFWSLEILYFDESNRLDRLWYDGDGVLIYGMATESRTVGSDQVRVVREIYFGENGKRLSDNTRAKSLTSGVELSAPAAPLAFGYGNSVYDLAFSELIESFFSLSRSPSFATVIVEDLNFRESPQISRNNIARTLGRGEELECGSDSIVTMYLSQPKGILLNEVAIRENGKLIRLQPGKAVALKGRYKGGKGYSLEDIISCSAILGQKEVFFETAESNVKVIEAEQWIRLKDSMGNVGYVYQEFVEFK
jgi:hypothetical protein